MPYSAPEFRVRILTEEAISELIVLVSEEIDARAGGLGGQRKAIEGELAYVRRRPARLYEALETTELTMQALSPRILALRQREDQLAAAREDADRQLRQRKPDLSTSAEIAEYVADFRRFLESGAFSEREAPIRKFVKSIEVVEDNATLTYTSSMPSDGVARGEIGSRFCPVRPTVSSCTHNLARTLELCSVDGPDAAVLDVEVQEPPDQDDGAQLLEEPAL